MKIRDLQVVLQWQLYLQWTLSTAQIQSGLLMSHGPPWEHVSGLGVPDLSNHNHAIINVLVLTGYSQSQDLYPCEARLLQGRSVLTVV